MPRSNIPKNFNWLNHIIEIQNRDNNKIAASGFTPWVLIGAFVYLAYLLLTGLKDIVNNNNNLLYFVISFTILSNLSKSSFEIFNSVFI